MPKKELTNLRGMLLLASSYIDEPLLEESVVLIINHNQYGQSQGLVINKQVPKLTVSKMLSKDEKIKFNNSAVLKKNIFQGGFHKQEQLFLIHDSSKLSKIKKCKFNPFIYISPSIYMINELVNLTSNYKFINGCMLWDNYELEDEIENNLWNFANYCNSDLIYQTKPVVLWRSLLALKGGIYRYYADNVKNPYLN